MVIDVYQDRAPGQARGSEGKFEVQRRTDTGWQSTCSREEIEEALREARRALTLRGTQAVRVVRETVDPATGMIRPTTVFRAAATQSEEPGLLRLLWRRVSGDRVRVPRRPIGAADVAVVLSVGLFIIGLGTTLSLLHH
jgi:hypothetical protein